MSNTRCSGSRFARSAAISLVLMASATMAIAQTDPVGGRGEPVELILVDMPLGDIVKAIADRTGNDYVYEPPLPGRMTVAVPSRVSRQEATEILNAALLIKGFVALPIAPNRFAISRWEKMSGSAPYTTRALDLGAEGAITTRIQLRHADPESVARALRPLLQDKGEAIPHAQSGSIILAGTENRIARLIGIARQLRSRRRRIDDCDSLAIPRRRRNPETSSTRLWHEHADALVRAKRSSTRSSTSVPMR